MWKCSLTIFVFRYDIITYWLEAILISAKVYAFSLLVSLTNSVSFTMSPGQPWSLVSLTNSVSFPMSPGQSVQVFFSWSLSLTVLTEYQVLMIHLKNSDCHFLVVLISFLCFSNISENIFLLSFTFFSKTISLLHLVSVSTLCLLFKIKQYLNS